MAKFFANLNLVLLVGLALAILIAVFPDSGYRPPTGDIVNGVLQWLHVFFGITWIGLLYYFNFVQTPTMPTVPAELKPGVSKYIAPKALFYFRWGAAFTVLTGLLLAWSYGELDEALTLQPSARLIGIGMWLALIMAFNVWFIIWPNQKKVLGLRRGRRRRQSEGRARPRDRLAAQHPAVDPDAAGDDQRPLGRLAR